LNFPNSPLIFPLLKFNHFNHFIPNRPEANRDQVNMVAMKNRQRSFLCPIINGFVQINNKNKFLSQNEKEN